MCSEPCNGTRRAHGHLAAVLLAVAAVAAAAGVFFLLFERLEKKKGIRFRRKRQIYRSADLDAEDAAQQAPSSTPDEG